MIEIGHHLDGGEPRGTGAHAAAASLVVRRLMPGAAASGRTIAALDRMYAAFGPGDAPDGTVPLEWRRRRAWLAERLATATSFVATLGPDALVHLALTPDAHGGWELALRQHPRHAPRAVSGVLLGRALALAAERRVKRVWTRVPTRDAWLRTSCRAVGFRRASGDAWEEEWAWRSAWLESDEELR